MPSTTYIDVNGIHSATNSTEHQKPGEELKNHKNNSNRMPPIVVANVSKTLSVTNTTVTQAQHLASLVSLGPTDIGENLQRSGQMKQPVFGVARSNEPQEDEDATNAMKVEPTISTNTSNFNAPNHTTINVRHTVTNVSNGNEVTCKGILPPLRMTNTPTAIASSSVSCAEIASQSLAGGVADCASALTESVSSAEKDFHVVKIKISPDSKRFSESIEITTDPETEIKSDSPSVQKKKITVVNLTSAGDNSTQTDNNQQSASEELDTMVQKSNANPGTSITELNVSNPTYLYYMMTSGQFSPSDTLDSGTCSDMDNTGNTTSSNTPPPLPKKVAPNIEMHLKNTKDIENNDRDHHHLHHRSRALNHDHQRAGSLTDSEESESSLSCESLTLSDGLPTKLSFLPDSLLRDIRNRKFSNCPASPDGGYLTKIDLKYANNNNANDVYNDRNKGNESKFAHGFVGDNKKNSVLIKEGTYADRCASSVGPTESRKFENDKFYTFHVNEHDFSDLVENEPNNFMDDAFAGYKDLSNPASATSTIRSSKGTVRGVKNRVRNGIATFLQMQQSNVKSFKEKDIGKVVLYTTSMGIIRETYAKCSNMKQILRTLLVKFEERDIFMSSEYQQEIKERMQSDEVKVPQLFVEGQHIGDAEHVERLNESGELRQLLRPYKSMSSTYTCQTCGGYRLLPCPSCCGSKKSVHRNHFTTEFVALKCMNCDEVGLVKCHNC